MGLFLVLLMAVWALPDVVRAQERSCDIASLQGRLEQHKHLALHYAPVYWFGPGERYFPTLPFFPAFDSVSNEGTAPGRDFEDSTEIAPRSGASLSWNKLDSLYDGDDASKATRSAIFYRVRKLDNGQKKNIFRYLRSDEQAWDRLHIDRTFRDGLERDDTHFQVIEYYAYYINDFGLIGHPYDVEFLYVFVPEDRAVAERFRIVVGAGHTTRTPNNVLVSTGGRSGVIVELGDHSNAPDVPPYGMFTPGLDANWHAYDVWGTRDLQASAGLGAVGQYALAMTFPRDTATSVQLFPPVQPETLTAQGVLLKGDTARSRRFRYSLAPAEVFECLHERLSRPAPSPGGTLGVDSLMSLMLDYGVWRGFRGFEGLTESWMKDTAVLHMRAWNEDLLCKGSPCNGKHRISRDRYQPWRHSQYRTDDPTRVFKRHLFRPVSGAAPFLSLFRYWLTWQPGNAALVEGGFEVPANLPGWRKLPIRLAGYLEVHGGIYMRCRNLLSSCGAADSVAGPRSRRFTPVITFLHTGHYNRAITYYVRLSWIVDRHRIDGGDASSTTMAGGVSLVPASLHWPGGVPILNWVCSLRVRIGLATGVHRTGPRLGDARWEVQLSSLHQLLPLDFIRKRNPACT